ncbi:MAG TPA: lipopolysaccharide kinase InaA family protein [Verrucomicrobiae bacterium]|nr:lipopolysaccharide kinase InaA family protein [Verrucomicrobiae bacterium]
MAFHDSVTIAPGWQEVLQRHALATVDALYRLQDGEVLLGGKATELRRVELRDEKETRVLYIKKYWYPTPRLRWSGFYRGTFLGISKVRREYENLARLRAWRLDAPAPIAYGEERQNRWLHRSFLISEGVHSPTSLDLFICDILPTMPVPEQRKQRTDLIQKLADYTRRMHEHHFVHHDYFWRNILLSERSLEHFYLIDSHKGRCWSPWEDMPSRAKDLATLDSPAPWFFRRSERLRFFLHYRAHKHLTSADKDLLHRVLRLAEPLRAAQRKRVRDANAVSNSGPV